MAQAHLVLKLVLLKHYMKSMETNYASSSMRVERVI